jgi:tRNA pseudouridine38-40 synthase
VKVTSAGRTDSGVHATGQVVSVATTAAFNFERLAVALNALLPADCSIREVRVVDETFSARFSARERTYIYAILNQPERSALLGRYAWHFPRVLDLEAMLEAAAAVVGEHDFQSFGSAPPVGAQGRPASTVRRLTRFTIEPRGALLRIEVVANAFLRHMVRSLVGTLVECGAGRRSAAEMGCILKAADRSAVRLLAPAAGLYFAGVRYADGYDSFAEPPLLAPTA